MRRTHSLDPPSSVYERILNYTSDIPVYSWKNVLPTALNRWEYQRIDENEEELEFDEDSEEEDESPDLGFIAIGGKTTDDFSTLFVDWKQDAP